MRRILVAILACAASCGVGQNITDLFRQGAPVAHMAIGDLPDEYHAVELRSASESGLGELFGGPMAALMMMGGFHSDNGNQDSFLRLLSMSAIAFTKGETMEVSGTKFLITYMPAINAANIQGIVEGHAKPDLELTLVRFDSIKSITPKPDVNKVTMLQQFAGPPPPSPEESRTKTLSNFKQLALGMIMYSSDSDDVFPYVQDTKSALAVDMPYLKNREVMKSYNPGSEVRFNMAVAGVAASAIAAPADTPLYYESAAWPDGKRCVAFCDGHVKLVDPTEWERLQAALHLKMPRSGKPLPPFYWRQLHFDDIPAPPNGGAPADVSPPRSIPPARSNPPPKPGGGRQ